MNCETCIKLWSVDYQLYLMYLYTCQGTTHATNCHKFNDKWQWEHIGSQHKCRSAWWDIIHTYYRSYGTLASNKIHIQESDAHDTNRVIRHRHFWEVNIFCTLSKILTYKVYFCHSLLFWIRSMRWILCFPRVSLNRLATTWYSSQLGGSRTMMKLWNENSLYFNFVIVKVSVILSSE